MENFPKELLKEVDNSVFIHMGWYNVKHFLIRLQLVKALKQVSYIWKLKKFNKQRR